MLAIPGLGPFIAAGPIVAAPSGVGAGGTVGGIAGALIGMGIDEHEAKRYEGRVQGGSILLSVHCDDSDWTERAKEILEETGAEDIASTGEASPCPDPPGRHPLKQAAMREKLDEFRWKNLAKILTLFRRAVPISREKYRSPSTYRTKQGQGV